MIDRFVRVLEEILAKDGRSALVLSGIRQYSFRKSMEKYPERVFDIGIMESTAVGFAAGLAAAGMIPFLHTWTPFLIERAFEQLKLDFGSQNLEGNFIGSGASYDLTALGESHYCPEDIAILKQIKNMQIVVPGTAAEWEQLFLQSYQNGSPTFYRLSNEVNHTENVVVFGRANIIQKGNKGTVVVVGPLLDTVLKAVGDKDVTILYYTTVEPFDYTLLRKNISGNRILICEPYNKSAVLYNIIDALRGEFLKIEMVGIDINAKCCLGSYQDNIPALGLDEKTIASKLQKLLQ